ncbi:hypothetical protein DFH27DRAFT_559469 [Peziza echinospora]|nr:hypothetical protein DFH27DRAFT_559469 [Peziza echinospora]
MGWEGFQSFFCFVFVPFFSATQNPFLGSPSISFLRNRFSHLVTLLLLLLLLLSNLLLASSRFFFFICQSFLFLSFVLCAYILLISG